MQKKRILFIYVNFSSFVKTDFEILSTFANVTKYQFKPGKGIFATGYKLFGQFLFLLVNIWHYDTVYIWFADFHSLLPVLISKIVGKKSFLVIGGYEVARIKSMNYGALCSGLRAFFCISSIRLSTLNLTVSNYVDRKVKYIVPGSKRQLVPNCVDLITMPNFEKTKENLVLTVGIIENQRSFFLKGIDTFIEIAGNLPEYQFIIIGLDRLKLAELLMNIPENLTILGRVAHEELDDYYQRSKFYCQLSRSESFGVSVAEAMYYGCVPIVTNEGGLPELVGEMGFIVRRNPIYISQLIKENSQSVSGLQPGFSNRILSCFSREKRGRTILKLVSQPVIG